MTTTATSSSLFTDKSDLMSSPQPYYENWPPPKTVAPTVPLRVHPPSSQVYVLCANMAFNVCKFTFYNSISSSAPLICAIISFRQKEAHCVCSNPGSVPGGVVAADALAALHVGRVGQAAGRRPLARRAQDRRHNRIADDDAHNRYSSIHLLLSGIQRVVGVGMMTSLCCSWR